MYYTIFYRNKYDIYNFTPFLSLTEAKALYLKYIWWGCRAVQIEDGNGTIIWGTKEPVYRSIINPNPTPDLPF